MKRLALFFTLFFCAFSFAEERSNKMETGIYNISVKNNIGEQISLSGYEGKVLLIVNVASKCGYTPQYDGLQNIYSKYKDQGFEVLAFPCNDFGGQEPGTNQEIQEFCTTNFGVEFPLFDKVKVLGDEKSDLYELLTNSPAVENGDVKWNFEKFLVSKTGEVISRFKSNVQPESEELTTAIENALAP
jgi:glutathione peroxidase